MPGVGAGRGHYATATKAVKHGAACVQDGFAGIAIKQVAAPGGTGLGSALIATVQVNELFEIQLNGSVRLANRSFDPFAKGDPVYVGDSDNGIYFAKTAGNEVQTVTVTATGGTFKLTFDGQQTAAIAYNALASAVETALEALSNLDVADVAVAGAAGGPYTVTFAGVDASADVPPLVADGSALTGPSHGIVVATTAQGQPAASKLGRVEALLPDGVMVVNLGARKTF